MAAKLTILDRALTRQLLARQALKIKDARAGNTTSQLNTLAQNNNINLSTLYRLMDTYQRGGLDALLNKRGPQPLKSTDPVVIDYARQLIISDPSAKGSIIINNIEATALYNGWRIGCRASLYRLLNRLRQELNIQPHNHKPSCNRDKIHNYVDLLPLDKLDKVESYLEFLFSQSTGDHSDKHRENTTGTLQQPTLDL